MLSTKISCEDCEANYVGQTKRKLKTKLNEHISDIKKKIDSPSVITDHHINYNHNFNWKDVIISIGKSLDKELILIINILVL